MNPYNFNIGDHFRTKFNDNQIERHYLLTKIDYDRNSYSLRDLATNQVILETRENLSIYYIKKENY